MGEMYYVLLYVIDNGRNEICDAKSIMHCTVHPAPHTAYTMSQNLTVYLTG
jgi:hypothetical protein